MGGKFYLLKSSSPIAFLFGLLLILSYLLPYLLMGTDSYILIHDCLDSNLIWYKILSDPKIAHMPTDGTISSIFNGLPRASLGSEFKLWVYLTRFFDIFGAYVINQAITRAVAYIGTYLLIKKITTDHFASLITAVFFALLPYWPPGGITVAGLPLFVWCIWDFVSVKPSFRNLIPLLLIPLHSSLLLSYSFLILLLFVFFTYDCIAKRKFNLLMFLSLLIPTSIFFAVEYRVVNSFFISPTFISHRTEFNHASIGLYAGLKDLLNHLRNGHYHVGSVPLIPIATAILGIFFSKTNTQKRTIIFCLIFVLFSALAFSFWNYSLVNSLKEHIPLLRMFNFSRIYFLEPLFLYVAFAISLSTIRHSKLKYLSYLVTIAQFVILISQHDQLVAKKTNPISYKRYISQASFDDIKKILGPEELKYNFISVGLHPTLASSHGLRTLDFYIPNYPLQYKHQFKEVIINEISKDTKLYDYYENWGSRVYAFSAQIGKNPLRSNTTVIKGLDYNFEKLKSMSAKYLISRLPIISKDLSLIKKITKEDSQWDIYLYRLN